MEARSLRRVTHSEGPVHPTDRDLLQYIARALEPPAEEQLVRWLASSPRARARLSAIQASQRGEPAPSWSLPPPGRRAGTLAGSARAAAVMDASGSGWIEVALEVAAEHLGDTVVVLERDEVWAVTHPGEKDDEISVFMLEILPDGRRRLDLMPAAETKRLAVVLCPPALAASRDWDALRSRLDEGSLPCVTVDVAALRNKAPAAP